VPRELTSRRRMGDQYSASSDPNGLIVMLGDALPIRTGSWQQRRIDTNGHDSEASGQGRLVGEYQDYLIRLHAPRQSAVKATQTFRPGADRSVLQLARPARWGCRSAERAGPTTPGRRVRPCRVRMDADRRTKSSAAQPLAPAECPRCMD